LGPLLGGRFVDFFSVRNLSLNFTWADPGRILQLPALNLTGYDFLFGITFLLGLVTLNVLAVLREEGEVGREVVLDALLAPMRHVSRPMSTVPGLSFLSHFPYGYVRRVPIPGLDVAFGVMSYEIAELARVATTAAARGRGAATRIVGALEDAVSQVWKPGGAVEAHAVEMARQVGRGTMHAVGEVAMDIGQLARQAVLGVGRALRRRRVDPRQVMLGVGQGVVQGAIESGADLREAVSQGLEGAREASGQVGLDAAVATAWVARGMLEAARAYGPEAVAQVEAALPAEPLAADLTLPEGEATPEGGDEEGEAPED